ncbi:lysophospholipid acyltransferase family protein [Desulforhopalus singaporensis]|uniref:Predicted acyltransferase, LPLAT superfamily n=1 Tax=Desulforhopalus singaporensis TaxID=91360 RepID=A0A1H0T4G2_9BACT|nr:lysophospholipid acyltransferase family protein [Desulforhopalus singaporensis]SDP48952.1 Predicted acyltransferase, LPLAT superfamily [Desulforhopalus singaporensis]
MSAEKKRFGEICRRLETLGHWFFYVAMRFFGHGGGRLLLGPVVFCYVLFSRKIHKIVGYYLVRRFPGKSWLCYRLYVLKIIYSFGGILVDRGWLGLSPRSDFQGELIGYERIKELIGQGNGVVLVTAHVGNWQSALERIGELPVRVHALMQYDREAAKHFFDLGGKKRSFEIIDVNSSFGGMIEAAAALQRGEVVTIMGDRYTRGPFSEVEFLGDTVRVTNGAYSLAATCGAPVVILLAAKTGAKTYNLTVVDSFQPEYCSRDEREGMLRDCSSRFMEAIEEYLQMYPYQWYNFYNFWDQ